MVFTDAQEVAEVDLVGVKVLGGLGRAVADSVLKPVQDGDEFGNFGGEEEGGETD